MCSYAYYQLNTNLITDHEFDQLGKDILANYDNIETPRLLTLTLKHLMRLDSHMRVVVGSVLPLWA